MQKEPIEKILISQLLSHLDFKFYILKPLENK